QGPSWVARAVPPACNDPPTRKSTGTMNAASASYVARRIDALGSTTGKVCTDGNPTTLRLGTDLPTALAVKRPDQFPNRSTRVWSSEYAGSQPATSRGLRIRDGKRQRGREPLPKAPDPLNSSPPPIKQSDHPASVARRVPVCRS